MAVQVVVIVALFCWLRMRLPKVEMPCRLKLPKLELVDWLGLSVILRIRQRLLKAFFPPSSRKIRN